MIKELIDRSNQFGGAMIVMRVFLHTFLIYLKKVFCLFLKTIFQHEWASMHGSEINKVVKDQWFINILGYMYELSG